MKRLAMLVIVAALAWSGYWAVSAQQLRGAVETWFEDRRAEGWQAEYSALRVRGFPNRLDVTLEDVALADPDRGIAWTTPAFQALRLVYSPDHTILAFAPEQTFQTPEAEYRVTSDALRASVVWQDGLLERAGLEADALAIDGPDRIALRALTAGLAAEGTRDAAYRLGVEADTVGDAPGHVSLQAEIDLDTALTRGTLADGRPQPVRIDLRQAEYSEDSLRVRLAGTVEADSAGRARGEMTLRADGWRALLERAVEDGIVPAGLAGAVRDGLGLLTALSGDPDRLEVPLRFEGGTTRLGPVPLGPAPRLRAD